MTEKSPEATVTFSGKAFVLMKEMEFCVFVPKAGDPKSMASSFAAAEKEELVLYCKGSRFIRANRHTCLTSKPEDHLQTSYRYEVHGNHLRVWKLDLSAKPIGLFQSHPSGVKPAKERKKPNVPFQNAVWRVFYNGPIQDFISKYHG